MAGEFHQFRSTRFEQRIPRLSVSSANIPSSTQVENPACTCLPEAAVSLQSLQHGRQPSHRCITTRPSAESALVSLSLRPAIQRCRQRRNIGSPRRLLLVLKVGMMERSSCEGDRTRSHLHSQRRRRDHLVRSMLSDMEHWAGDSPTSSHRMRYRRRRKCQIPFRLSS